MSRRIRGVSVQWTASITAALCFVPLAFAQPHNKVSPKPLTIEQLIEKSRFQEADAQLRERLTAKPDDVHAMNLVGVLRLKQRKFRQAESIFGEVLTNDPGSGEAARELANLLASENRVTEAIQAAHLWQKISPSDVRANELLAALYEQSGDFTRSFEQLQSIPKEKRTPQMLPLVIGVAALAGHNETADALMPELLKSAKRDPELVASLAHIFLRHNSPADAAELLKISQPVLQPTASILAIQAELVGRQGNLNEARRFADRARAADPKSLDALKVSAQIAGRMKDWRMTARFLQEALNVGAPRVELLQGLSYAYMQLDDLDNARVPAEQLCDLLPGDPNAKLALALIYVRAKHWGEAEPMLREVLTKEPENKAAHLAQGIVSHNLGDSDSSATHLRASLGESPQADGEAHYYLGLIAKARGDLSGATTELETARKTNPEKYEIQTALGQLYMQQNQFDRARPILEGAVKAMPEDAQAHYQLGMLYRRLGLAQLAKQQLEEFSRINARTKPAPMGEESMSKP